MVRVLAFMKIVPTSAPDEQYSLNLLSYLLGACNERFKRKMQSINVIYDPELFSRR